MLEQLRNQRERKMGRITVEEDSSLKKLKELLSELSEKYGMDYENLVEVLNKRENYLTIPASIFNNELSPLENAVLYLSVKFRFTQTEIAKLLNRDHTTIWTTLMNAEKKIKQAKFREMVERGELFVPVEIFADEKLSILEGLSIYMKEKLGMSYHEIALALGKDDRTIWTVVNRGIKKLR